MPISFAAAPICENRDTYLSHDEWGGRNEFHFVFVPDRKTVCENLIKGGYLEFEKLVNMSKHDFRLEPNPSLTPD